MSKRLAALKEKLSLLESSDDLDEGSVTLVEKLIDDLAKNSAKKKKKQESLISPKHEEKKSKREKVVETEKEKETTPKKNDTGTGIHGVLCLHVCLYS